MRITILALALALALGPIAAPAQTGPTLRVEDLEARLEHAPRIAIAEDASEAQRYAIEEAEAKGGFTLTGGVSAGTFNEPVTSTSDRAYRALSGQLAVRYPLFGEGSATRAAIGIERATLLQRNVDLAIARAQVLQELRGRYVDYWAATRKLALGNDLLDAEQATKEALVLRRRAGLVLRSDEIEAATTFELIRRNNATFVRDRARALGELRIVTGAPLETFEPVDPRFGDTCPSADDFTRTAVDRSAQVAAYHEAAAKAALLAGKPPSPVRAGVSVGQSIALQQPATGTASGTTISLDVSLPLDGRRANSAAQRKYVALADGARRESDLAEARIAAEAQDAWLGYQQAKVNLVFAELRLHAADTARRETDLRYGKVATVTIETRQRVRSQYYAATVDELDARRGVYEQQAALRFYAPDGCAARPPGAGVPAGFAAYAWKARAVLSEASSTGFWNRLAERGVNRFLLSFDAAEISELRAPSAFRERVTAFIADSDRHGVPVELLLGEPSWILPERRPALIAIVENVRDVPFAGIELDMEPDQLHRAGLTTSAAVREMGRSAVAVAAAARVPVGVSLHVRYLEDDSSCLVCALQTGGIKRVTAMAYTTNADLLVRRMSAIVRAHPAMRFALAQSIEPELPSSESYAGISRSAFRDVVEHLRSGIAAPNFAGIVVETYDDLRLLK